MPRVMWWQAAMLQCWCIQECSWLLKCLSCTDRVYTFCFCGEKYEGHCTMHGMLLVRYRVMELLLTFQAMMPVFTMFLSWLILKERFPYKVRWLWEREEGGRKRKRERERERERERGTEVYCVLFSTGVPVSRSHCLGSVDRHGNGVELWCYGLGSSTDRHTLFCSSEHIFKKGYYSKWSWLLKSHLLCPILDLQCLRDVRIHHLRLLLVLCQIATVLLFPIWMYTDVWYIITQLHKVRLRVRVRPRTSISHFPLLPRGTSRAPLPPSLPVLLPSLFQ